MNFDYFYGPEDAEQYQFFRIPKRLITGDEFQDISTDSKLLYGLMLDRLQLSIRSKWMDDLNRIYTVEEIMEDMHCGNQKAVKMLSELEKKIGLIKRKRQGLGKPSLIYVMKFSTPSPQKSPESHFKKCENHTSGDVKITSQEVWKSHGNNTDINQTDNNQTDPIHLSGKPAELCTERKAERMDTMRRDEMEERRLYENYLRDHLYIDELKERYPYDHGRIEEIVELMVDTICSKAPYIRCGGEDRPAEVVRSRFMKLDSTHIEYVLDSIHENTTDVRNIKAYLLTSLYNAPITIDHYYTAKVQHDMYGWKE